MRTAYATRKKLYDAVKALRTAAETGLMIEREETSLTQTEYDKLNAVLEEAYEKVLEEREEALYEAAKAFCDEHSTWWMRGFNGGASDVQNP